MTSSDNERPIRIDRSLLDAVRRRENNTARYQRSGEPIRVVDPGTAISVEGVSVRRTAYVGPRLLLSWLADQGPVMEMLRAVATPLQWELTLEGEDEPRPRVPPAVRKIEISVSPKAATQPPDGFELLQRARATFKREDFRYVGLDHVIHPMPFDWG
ncbi:hypothetical protein, partial [Nocardioides sp.]|uniref:hypothetical protein n=1 Tax=Nocardioides sp. TaxID=35761 RepID=UPI0031FEFA94|nr:peptidase and in, kexin, sedolisin [Nocardioides sp.]